MSESLGEQVRDLWQLDRGDSPLVIDVPHSGTYLSDALRSRLTPVALTVPDTDWHVERLYAFARDEGATVLCATHSRYVVDLNRDPSGQALYAGADNTELCPTQTFANEPIYRDALPSPVEVGERVAACFEPYHATLAAEIARVRLRHGFVILLDAHSIRTEVPRFFPGRLPDLNLGTANGASCASSMAVSRVAGSRATTGDRRKGCMRCNWKWRRIATWTRRRRIDGTPPARAGS